MKSGWKPAGQEQCLKSGVTLSTESDSSKALVWFQQKIQFPCCCFLWELLFKTSCTHANPSRKWFEVDVNKDKILSAIFPFECPDNWCRFYEHKKQLMPPTFFIYPKTHIKRKWKQVLVSSSKN